MDPARAAPPPVEALAPAAAAPPSPHVPPIAALPGEPQSPGEAAPAVDRVDAPPAEGPPPAQGLSAWQRIERPLIVLGVVAGIVAAVSGVRSCRVGEDAARHGREADSALTVLGNRTLAATELIAGTEAAMDTARRMDAAARAASERAAAAATEARERQRQAVVAALDAEMAVRVGLLVDSLNAVGFEPTPTRRPDEGAHYGRLSRAFQRFLEPRDRMSQGVQSLRTYDLIASIGSDGDPELRRALLYLRGITGRSPYEDFSGAGWRSSGPDTPSVVFFEPGAHSPEQKPIGQVLQAFSLKRWSR